MSLLMPTLKSAHDASASVAIAVMINLVMMYVGCEFWGFLAECQPPECAN